MTLAHPVSVVDQVVTVDAGVLHVQDILTVDDESMRVLSLMSPVSAQVLRGQEGTYATVHRVGTRVEVVGGLDVRQHRSAARDERVMTAIGAPSPFERWARDSIRMLLARVDALERRT